MHRYINNTSKSQSGTIQADGRFHTLPECILTFLIICSYVQNKLKSMYEEGVKNAFPENVTMRVPLLSSNLFSANKCNSKLVYIEL